MTETAPSTNTTAALQDLARTQAEDTSAHIQDAISNMATQFVRGTVVAVDADNRVQILRSTSIDEEGAPLDPDPAFYPVINAAGVPKVGAQIWGLGNNGGVIVLGTEAGTGAVQPPIGSGKDWYSATLPADGKWLFLDGSVYSRTAYPLLFAAIGTTWNTGGEGASQFRVPDHRSRSAVGAGQGVGLTNRILASRFGEENHLLTTGEMPGHIHSPTMGAYVHGHGNLTGSSSHAHSGTTGGANASHSHGYDAVGIGSTLGTPSGGAINAVVGLSHTTTQSLGENVGHGHDFSTLPGGGQLAISNDTHAHTLTGGSTGGGTTHNNMQPSIAVYKIIRALP